MTPGFRFDGSNSDLAQQFYTLSLLQDETATSSGMNYTHAELPERVQKRLEGFNLRFGDLSGYLQRAVVWDSGFAIDLFDNFVATMTKDNLTMAQISVDQSDVESAGCTTTKCVQPNGFGFYHTELCTGEQILTVAKCVLADFRLKGNGVSMWASGGDYTGAPEMHAVGHVWTDPESQVNNSVRAIHTQAIEQTATWGKCMDADTKAYGTMVIPCFPYDLRESSEITWHDPPFGELVTQWLNKTSLIKANAASEQRLQPTHGRGEESTPHLGVEIAISVGTTALLLLAIVALLLFQRRKRRKHTRGNKSIDAATNASDRDDDDDGALTSQSSATTSRSLSKSDRADERNVDINANSVTKTLYGDANIASSHLAFEKIAFDRIVSKGGYGEVWLCRYEANVVAVKRLLQTKQQAFRDIEVFTSEIQLTASLHHPHILRFLGVAWNNLQNLCMVVEYLPSGDLQKHLKTHRSTLSWECDKLRISLGLAKALRYLHHRQPAIIHRDLKSKNVLLTERGDAKLIDFGVSRNLLSGTMTAGVGTAYWTAPEILNGTKYTEKCDIYSFGVLLSEIDTCLPPYHDAMHPTTGHKLQAFQIMNLVIEGNIKPSVNADCPPRVKEVVDACLQFDPSARPSADALVEILENGLSGERNN